MILRCLVFLLAAEASLVAWQQTAAKAVILSQPLPSADQIAQLEQDIARDPDGIPRRVKALELYAAAAPLAKDDYRAARLRHIQFLVQQNPAGEAAATTLGWVGSRGGPYANPKDHASVRALWATEASQHFNDPSVTLNALRFLAIEDKQQAEELFETLMAAEPAATQIATHLGFFYAAGMVAADTMDGRVVAVLSDSERSAWGAHCRAQVERNLNPHVLMGAATALPNMAMRRMGGGSTFEALVKYSEELRRRAATLDADVRFTPAEMQMFADEVRKGTDQPGSNAPGVPFTPNQIRVAGNVQSANVLLAPPPNYPPLAMQANIQGTVRLQVVIGQDGAVTNVQLISGHPLLVQAALDAVRSWTYKPTMLNGNPVSVVTTVDVPFTLPPL